MAERNKQAITNPIIKLMINILISTAVGFAIFIFLILLFSYVTTKMKNACDYFVLFALISTTLSSFTAGFVAVKRIRKNGLAMGLCTGFILLIFIILVFVIFADFELSQDALLVIPSALLPSALSGVLAVNIEKRARR